MIQERIQPTQIGKGLGALDRPPDQNPSPMEVRSPSHVESDFVCMYEVGRHKSAHCERPHQSSMNFFGKFIRVCSIKA